MSAGHSTVLRATALQASAALARYERHVRKLASSWLDMELYQLVSAEIDEIKLYSATLPHVAVPWAALLTSHAELIHALWRSQQAGAARGAPQVEQQLQEHLACVDSMARRCLRLAASFDAPGLDFRG